jgi:hypothetical protein
MTTELEALERATVESPRDKRHILSLWVGNETVIDFTFKAPANLDTWVPKPGKRYRKKWRDVVEPDLAEASRNRAAIERYNAKKPADKYPDSKILPRDPRNASPTRKKDAGVLNAFWDYRELNKSLEPVQSNHLQADNDNYGYDPDSVEGDAKKPLRDAEAEWEIRPNPKEMADRYDVTTVKYETRQAGLITGPRLSDCGYCMAPTSPFIREMKIPVSGDIECMVTYTTVEKKGIRSVEVERQKLVKIGDLKKGDRWTLYQIGDLRFAPYRTKHHYRGQVTHYRDNGRWHPAKDEYGTPYGPTSKGSDGAFWVPLKPRKTKSKLEWLTPAEKAKQRANRDKPIPCQTPTDEMFEAFRLKLETNGKPANDNRQHDGLPYDVKSADELQFGYAFGKTYNDPDDSEPFDDVIERKSDLAAVNARLSPQALLVANMIVLTDQTETLAQNYVALGAALSTGRAASERTLMRHGQKAANDAAVEIGTVLQELAA